jgi:hypothetical protein
MKAALFYPVEESELDLELSGSDASDDEWLAGGNGSFDSLETFIIGPVLRLSL